MTRPDARLLVPVPALPGGRAPEGARRVLRCRVCLDEQVHYSGCDAPDAGDHCTSPHDCGGRAAWFIDLSRPDVVDGADVRLDALAFACSVLAKRHKAVARALLLHDLDLNRWRDVEEANSIALRRDESPIDLDPGVGLPRCMASRAVVAAALRGAA